MGDFERMNRRFQFDLFADYFQFYLQDETVKGDLSESWTPEAAHRMLATAPGTIGVGTVRNMIVPVTVEIADAAPDDDTSAWDQVNECTLDAPSGRVVIAGSDVPRGLNWGAPPFPGGEGGCCDHEDVTALARFVSIPMAIE